MALAQAVKRTETVQPLRMPRQTDRRGDYNEACRTDVSSNSSGIEVQTVI
jgi:hypothetical protein